MSPQTASMSEPDREQPIIDLPPTAEFPVPAPEPPSPLAQLCRPGPSPLAGSAADNPASAMAVPNTEQGHRNFGLALAHAAMAQANEFVIYSVSYTRIAYPRGDVPALYGVCTDVIIRAYRSLGIDLQELVHLAAPRSGDRNIQHRRTEVLRKFFARQGTSLPVTDYPEDYRPGDIVTYHRPNNTASKSHIAIVTDIIAPSGRPMVVHNRGWGVQIEDALFLDQVTGHYRYFGQGLGRNDAPIASAPAAPTKKVAAETTVRADIAAITGRTAWSASGPAPDCSRGERAILANRDTRLCAPSRNGSLASPAGTSAAARR